MGQPPSAGTKTWKRAHCPPTYKAPFVACVPSSCITLTFAAYVDKINSLLTCHHPLYELIAGRLVNIALALLKSLFSSWALWSAVALCFAVVSIDIHLHKSYMLSIECWFVEFLEPALDTRGWGKVRPRKQQYFISSSFPLSHPPPPSRPTPQLPGTFVDLDPVRTIGVRLGAALLLSHLFVKHIVAPQDIAHHHDLHSPPEKELDRSSSLTTATNASHINDNKTGMQIPVVAADKVSNGKEYK